MITALTLSRHFVSSPVPAGVTRKLVQGKIASLEALHDARIAAADSVTTDAFIYLDDTDELPKEFAFCEAERMLNPSVGMVNFDTAIQSADGPSKLVSGQWSREWHVASPTAIHNAIVSTEAYRSVRSLIESGLYWTEYMIYYALAALVGSRYLPEVGYIYNVGKTGFSRHPLINTALTNSVAWSHKL